MHLPSTQLTLFVSIQCITSRYIVDDSLGSSGFLWRS